jgi:hypothetical protein
VNSAHRLYFRFDLHGTFDRAIAGFVARREALREGTRHLRHAVVASLEQGFGFLPAADDLDDELGAGDVPHEEFWRLTQGLARLGAELSRGGPVAYVETDYFGGSGDQAAMIWEDGEVASAPWKTRMDAIDGALLRLGAGKGKADDHFDALGLGRHRHTDDWVNEAMAEDRAESG